MEKNQRVYCTHIGCVVTILDMNEESPTGNILCQFKDGRTQRISKVYLKEPIVVQNRCCLTQQTNSMTLPITEHQLERFRVRRETGEYVQTIFPDLTAPEREFILSGITPDTWNEKIGGQLPKQS